MPEARKYKYRGYYLKRISPTWWSAFKYDAANRRMLEKLGDPTIKGLKQRIREQ